MFIRSTIFGLSILAFALPICILELFCFFAPLRARYFLACGLWSGFFVWFAKVMCGLECRVEGLENLPKTPCVALSNHQSAYETIFFQKVLPMQTWVLKQELRFIPFFGWGLAMLEPIAIRRGSQGALEQVLQQGVEKIKQGRWVILFPEGTRVPPGEYKRYSKTGATLAIAAQCPIIPIAHNAGVFWPKGFFIDKPGVISMRIGPAIVPKGKDDSAVELTKKAEDWIRAQVFQ